MIRIRVAKWVLPALVLGVVACDTPIGPNRDRTYPFALSNNDVFRWPSDRLPVKYFAEDLGDLRDFTTRGIHLWAEQFLYGEFDGRSVDDSSQADVLIRLEGGVPPAANVTDAPPVRACRGVTEFPPQRPDGELTGPLVVTVEWFADQEAGDVVNCIERVVLHEIGHTLGLLQHSPDDADLMFASPVVRFPSTTDRTTVQTLYHTAPTLRPWSGNP